MPFSPIETKSKGNFKKTNFLPMSEGTYVIRIVDEDHTEIYSHWINNRSIACLGSDICPVCQNNFKIMRESPKDYNKVVGWHGRNRYFYFNVLDRSSVKVCPQCQSENRKMGSVFPTNCTECNTLLVTEQPQPSNKVKVVSLPKKYMDNLLAIQQNSLDSDGNPLGLNTFDLIVVVNGKGSEKTITFMTSPNKDVVEVKDEDKNDVHNSVIRLSPDEINEFLKGVSLKDIFASRKADAPVEEDTKLAEIASTLEIDINKLF